MSNARHVRPDLPFREQIADATRLLAAWIRVRAAAGTEGVHRLWPKDFALHHEAALLRLRTAILTGRYHPSPLTRVRVRKATGGERLLAIPTVGDRILQTAAAMVLQERVGLTFSLASFAYQPNRGPKAAALRLAELIRPESWVVIADIEKFFDNVDHSILLELLSGDGALDAGGLSLIAEWLRAPVMDGGIRLQPLKGLPQGSPVSPVLANVYLTEFDLVMEEQGMCHLRYADDFVVLAASETEATRILRFIADWLPRHRRVRIKPAKSLYLKADQGFTFVGFLFTPCTRSIPDEKLEGFTRRVSELLSNPSLDSLPEVSQSHNDLVRGWSNYYGGTSAEIDAQLRRLDAWRHEECGRYCKCLALSKEVEVLAFAHLVKEARRAQSDDLSYPEWADPGATLHALEPLLPDQGGSSSAASQTESPFSKSREIRSEAIASRQPPVLLETGTLHVPTHGAYLSRVKGLLSVKRKKQPVFECSFEEVKDILVDGEGIALSTPMIVECAQRNIPLIVCARGGAPAARLVPVWQVPPPPLLERQLEAKRSSTGGALALAFVWAKLHNQRALLLYHGKYRRRNVQVRERLHQGATSICEVLQAVTKMEPAPPQELRRELTLLEARAAAHYWRGFAALIPAEWGFTARRYPHASDPANMLLNFGYWVLAARVWHAVERVRLHPHLGFLHTSRDGAPGLVLDLMEEFRQPVVDRAVLGLTGRGARIEVKRGGRLALRTRRLLVGAVDRTLRRTMRRRGRPPLAREIVEQAARVRRTVLGRAPYRGYHMPW